MDVERRLPICFQTLVREFQVSRRHESRIGELIVGNVIGKRGKLVVERRRKRIRFDEEKLLKKCIPRRPCPTTSELKAVCARSVGIEYKDEWKENEKREREKEEQRGGGKRRWKRRRR